MKIALKILPIFFICGCANLSTTKFIYSEPSGNSVSVEMPKEIQATNLSIKIDAKNGTAEIKADQIITQNQGTLQAGGIREANNLTQIGGAAGQITKGAVEGAIKGAVPIP